MPKYIYYGRHEPLQSAPPDAKVGDKLGSGTVIEIDKMTYHDYQLTLDYLAETLERTEAGEPQFDSTVSKADIAYARYTYNSDLESVQRYEHEIEQYMAIFDASARESQNTESTK